MADEMKQAVVKQGQMEGEAAPAEQSVGDTAAEQKPVVGRGSDEAKPAAMQDSSEAKPVLNVSTSRAALKIVLFVLVFMGFLVGVRMVVGR